MPIMVRQDVIALTIVALAFTTMRRVGTFIAHSKKDVDSFPWLKPRYLKFISSNNTMLVWIPILKTDPEGRGTMLVAKPTGDRCCPVELLKNRVRDCELDEPLFCHLNFAPTEAWLLTWIRNRMRLLGKNPLWYTLRSIRQGGTTAANMMRMPEVFLKASGGWKGESLELYRRDHLPPLQGRFARTLGESGGLLR